MSNEELIAIEKFAARLKLNFPIILAPKNFTDRMMNVANEYAIKRIDLAVDWAKLEAEKQAQVG